MKYKYHADENTFEIKDGMKTQLIVIFLILFFNLFTGSKKLLKTYKSQEDYAFLDIYWILIMLASCIILIYFLKKRSYLAKIPVEQIKFLREKSVFGTTQLYFELINGKRRYLYKIRKNADIEEFQKALLEAGISTIE